MTSEASDAKRRRVGVTSKVYRTLDGMERHGYELWHGGFGIVWIAEMSRNSHHISFSHLGYNLGRIFREGVLLVKISLLLLQLVRLLLLFIDLLLQLLQLMFLSTDLKL